jgi:hypothetical protein
METETIPAQGINIEGLQHSPTVGAIANALAIAQGKMEGAKKDSANPFFKSRYADLAAVVGSIRGPLAESKIAHIQSPGTDEQGEFVDTMFMHESGEWLRSRIRMKPQKNDPQGIGSVITYMRRYSLQAMAGLEAEDDDGNGASGKDTDNRARKAPTQTLPEGSYTEVPKAETPASANPGANAPIITKWQDITSHVGKVAKGKKLGDLSDTVLAAMLEVYGTKECKTKEDNLLKTALLMWSAQRADPQASYRALMEKMKEEKADPEILGRACHKRGLTSASNAFDFTPEECKVILENWEQTMQDCKDEIDSSN